jgi:WD40 repeat protein
MTSSGRRFWLALASFAVVASVIVQGGARMSSVATRQSTSAPAQPELLVQSSHSELVTRLVFSPDSNYLATASVDGTVKLWDLKLGRLVRTLPISQYWVHSVAFSPDGRLLAVGAGDHTVTIWDVLSWTIQHTLRGHAHAVVSVVFSPDGALLATASRVDANDAVSPPVAIWDVRSGQRLRTLNAGRNVRSVGFVDASQLLTVDGLTMTVWNVSTGLQIRQVTQASFNANDVAVSPVGPFVAMTGYRYVTATNGIGALAVWDVRKETAEVVLDRDALPLAAVPARRAYVLVYRDRIERRHLDEGLTTAPAPPRWSPPFAVSNSADRIAGFASDGSVCVQALTPGATSPMCLSSRFEAVRQVAFSGKGDRLAVGLQSGALHVIDLVRGQPRAQRQKHVRAIESLQFDASGSRLLAASGDAVSAWDIATNSVVIDPESRANQAVKGGSIGATSPIRSIPAREEISPRVVPSAPRNLSIEGSPVFRSIFNAAIAPDGSVAAIGGYKHFVQLWDLRTGATSMLYESSGPGVTAMGFSPDSKRLVTGDEVGALAIFDVDRRVRTAATSNHRRIVSSVAFSPTTAGEFASVAIDGSLLVSSVGSQQPAREILAHETAVHSMAYTPDGKRLVTGAANGEIRIWSVPDLKRLASANAQSSAVNTVAVSPDGRLIVTGGEDATVTFRRADTLQPLVTLVLFDTREWLAFTPEGFFDGTERAWQRVAFRFPQNPETVYEPEQFFNVFFEPGLLSMLTREAVSLPEILRRNGSPRAASDLEQLRRSALPSVSIRPMSKPGGRQTTVEVSVTDQGSGMQDLRVFRNRSLVYSATGALPPQGVTKSFRVQVPVTVVAGENEITAYAFNRDNVRTKEAQVIARGPAEARPGRVFVLGVGINRYASGRNLTYAETDVRTALESLQARSMAGSPVQAVPLSDESATVSNIKQALRRLSGGDRQARAPASFDRFQRSQPEDSVIIYFAGHGIVDGDRYYVLTHEYIPSPDGRVVEGAAGTISDRELEGLLRGIDASRILLVLDSCFSGKLLDADETRPGPWNQRGLAQLAYEKGMYLVAAAQSYETAAEVSQLGHGLLTYALIREGLERFTADRDPRDGAMSVAEWVDFAAETVGTMSAAGLTSTGSTVSTPRLIGRKRPTSLQHARAFSPRDAYEQPWIVSRR